MRRVNTFAWSGTLGFELRVLRDDTPTGFPDRWAAIEAWLAREPVPDEELGRLLHGAALQRDPALPFPADVDGEGLATSST